MSPEAQHSPKRSDFSFVLPLLYVGAVWLFFSTISAEKGTSPRHRNNIGTATQPAPVTRITPAPVASLPQPAITIKDLQDWYFRIDAAEAHLNAASPQDREALERDRRSYRKALNDYYSQYNGQSLPVATSSLPASTSSISPAVVSSGTYYDYNYRPPVREHYVTPALRKDGTFVEGHYRTDRDESFWNNYSSAGNLNPHTGSVGNKTPPGGSSAVGVEFVRGYTRSDGTYVAPHVRSK